MAEVEYLHVCDLAFAAEGGKQCVIGIFDAIHATAFPATHARMSIATRFRGNPSEVLPIKIELARPNGDVLSTMQADLVLGPDGSAFLQLNLVGTVFPEAGRYTFKVSSAGRSLTTHSLQLLKAQSQPPVPSAPSGRNQFH
jgi:hypothetical protein